MAFTPRLIMRQLRERAHLRKLLGNTFWQLSDKILRLIGNVIVGIWVARYLGPMDFGLLNFATAFVALFSPLADLGLQVVVVRELVRRPEDRLQIVSSAFTLRLIGTAVAIAICYIGILIARPESSGVHLLVFVVAMSLLPQAWDVVDFDYQARTHARPITVIRSISLVTFAFIKVALIVSNAALVAFAWTVTGEAALSALLMWLIFRRQAPAFGLRRASPQEMKFLLQNCWPLAISGFSVILYMRIDQVMLGQLLDDHSVGIFSAAVRLSESWYFIPMAILSSVAPTLTAAHAREQREYEAKLVMVIRAMLILSIGAAAVLTFGSRPLVDALYGSSYADSAGVLALHAWAGVFVSLGVGSGPWFVNSGLMKLRMMHTLTGALVNIAMNLYMIPRFGPTGAAASTLVSYSLAASGLNLLSSRTRPVAALQARAVLARLTSGGR